MAKRYTDILRAPELKAAYDKYMAWSSKTPGEKSTLYDTLNVQKQTYTRTDGWVVPFSAAGLQFFVGIKTPTDGGGQERSALASALEFSAAPVRGGLKQPRQPRRL